MLFMICISICTIAIVVVSTMTMRNYDFIVLNRNKLQNDISFIKLTDNFIVTINIKVFTTRK